MQETILELLAEGGAITLLGEHTDGRWLFTLNIFDDFAEDSNSKTSTAAKSADSWEGALQLLDRYPWHHLYPERVHTDFRKAVQAALASRNSTDTLESFAAGAWERALTDCPFCGISESRIVGENEHAVWIYDGFPVSPGHSLVIPKRHVRSFFDITVEERESLFALLDHAKGLADKVRNPHGFNIGINDGPAAGQTVPHLHIHLIPRFNGDQKDPRGGVRWVIPEKADYWSARD
jgi:diadenosine tetraphosphate (Ap4A) HIT family hydrolase